MFHKLPLRYFKRPISCLRQTTTILFMATAFLLLYYCTLGLIVTPDQLLTKDFIEFRPGQMEELCLKDAGGEKRIIFFETSGERCLRPRQACAIESAALTNPDMSVYVYLAIDKPPGIPEPDQGEGLERHCKTMEVLGNYSNVFFIRQDLSEHLKGTQLESLYFNGSMAQSQYALQHLSDAVRVALLYKYGGIYLDLDVVVLRSLRCLRNTAGHVYDLPLGESSLENGVMIFDRGHKFLRYLMYVMKRTYDPEVRSVIGPHATTGTFQLMCNHSSVLIKDWIHEYDCMGDKVQIRLLNKTAFYPYSFNDRSIFYAQNFTAKDVFGQLAGTYSIHFYAAGHGVHVPETSFYAYIAKHFCPSIYHQHELRAYQF